MINTLKNWLKTFPGWPDAPFLTDTTVPDSLGAFPRGLEVVQQQRDILGGCRQVCRLTLELGRVCPQDEAAAQWLMELQSWVLEQSALGLAPRFGDEPARERIVAEKAGLKDRTVPGTGIYTVKLTAQFVKHY